MHASPVLRVAAAWLLVLALAVAAAVVTILIVNARIYGPQQQVRSYLAALRDGDGARALGLLNASVPKANPAMLDGAALKASVASLQNVTLADPVPTSGNQVQVKASYTLNDTAQNTVFELEKTGSEWLFFDRWTFVPTSLPTIDVSVVNQTEAALNDTQVALPNGKSQFAVFYPGRFEASYTSEYFVAPPVQSIVTNRQSPSAGSLVLRTAATPQLVDDLGTQIHKFLDQCAAHQVLAPAGCPFYYFTDNWIDAASIHWTITKYPTVVVEPFNGSWVLKPLTGTAQLSASQTNLFTGQSGPLTVSQNFSFAARLNVSDTNISVTPVIQY